MCQTKDGEHGGGSESAHQQPRCHDVEADNMPEGAEHNVRQRRVGIGEVGNELAGVKEVERGGYVVAALIPEVGQAKKGQVADRDSCEEEQKEGRSGKGSEPGARLANSIDGSVHAS